MSQKRTCGTCTACCKTHIVREIQKPAGEWCKHCQRGKGCAIYEVRPEDCRDFSCQWLMGTGTEDQRPSKTGIVLDFISFDQVGKTFVLFEAHARALKSVFALEIYRRAICDGYSVLIVPLSGTPQLSLAKNVTVPRERVALEDGRAIQVIRSR